MEILVIRKFILEEKIQDRVRMKRSVIGVNQLL